MDRTWRTVPRLDAQTLVEWADSPLAQPTPPPTAIIFTTTNTRFTAVRSGGRETTRATRRDLDLDRLACDALR
jgi:hypothetical protein